MEFNFINGLGAAIVGIMLLPNLIYAVRFPGSGSGAQSRMMNILEQIGRYGSIALMILPIGVGEFGFPGVAELLVYIFGNGALLLSYLIIWAFYFKRPSPGKAMALAVIPVGLFLLSGIALRHWLLVGCASVFGVGHIYITGKSSQKS